jgi:hypothetical protein
VQSRVLVHAIAASPLAKAAGEGLSGARRAREAGAAAMRELQVRRGGLGIATLLILAFLTMLWIKIRRLPAPGP